MKRLTLLVITALCIGSYFVSATEQFDVSSDTQQASLPDGTLIRAVFSQTGATFYIGDQMFYFDELDRSRAQWIYDSFVWGGVVYPVMGTIGYYSRYTAVARQVLGVRSLLTLMSLAGYVLNEWYAVSNIYYIWKAGAWYALPSALTSFGIPSLYQLFTGNPLTEAHIYSLAAGLKGVHSLGGYMKQMKSRTNTQYIHVPLTGDIAHHFVIKAVFQERADLPALYEVNVISASQLENNKNSSYHQLARVLGEHGIERILLLPDKGGKGALTTFFYDPEQDKMARINLAAEDVGESRIPWLLHAMHLKVDRKSFSSVRSALHPSVIQAVADSCSAYFDQQLCLHGAVKGECSYLDKDSGARNAFSVPNDFGRVAHIGYEIKKSIFTFGSDDEQEPISVDWQEGMFWPGMTVVANDNSRTVKQWLIPEWASRFLTAELASRGRNLAASAVDQAGHLITRAAGVVHYRRMLDHRREHLAREAALRREAGQENNPVLSFLVNMWIGQSRVSKVALEDSAKRILAPYTPTSDDDTCPICASGEDGGKLVGWPSGGTAGAQPYHILCIEKNGVYEANKRLGDVVLAKWRTGRSTIDVESSTAHSPIKMRLRVTEWQTPRTER
ncbi:hypothetical protein [Parendozoicomonas sp. Alg238-R29]|uniref:hypothetical protein n=1 Tax=Parendozoicomonas sp. Alg238-R29 TaxID=2993446 RepID=UPI00248EF52A|nr:hypothetical protein [Parendozoicomonas sp. Alg238-R29]